MKNQNQRSVAIHLRSRQYEAANTELFRNIAETFGDEIDFGSVFDKKDDDDMHGFSVHHTDKNGHSSYSFYSTDVKLVEEFAKMFK